MLALARILCAFTGVVVTVPAIAFAGLTAESLPVIILGLAFSAASIIPTERKL